MPRLPIARLVLVACFAAGLAAQTESERLIETGHWKRARALVEERIRQAPGDPLANYLLSQIRNAFGDHDTPLALAEKAVAVDGRTAKYHRQVAEVMGVMAQHANVLQQALLAHRFRREIDAALALDPRDAQAWRDLMEYYLLAPGIIGGDARKAADIAARLRAIDPVRGWLAQARLDSFQKRPAQAEASLHHAVEAVPGSYRARIALAEFCLAAQPPNLEAARHEAQEAVAIDATRVDAYALLAEIYAAREHWAELDATLATAAREIPDDAAPFYRAADRLLTTGSDLPRAQRYLQTYLAQPPEGNQPTVADARAKLAKVNEKLARTGARPIASSSMEAARQERSK